MLQKIQNLFKAKESEVQAQKESFPRNIQDQLNQLVRRTSTYGISFKLANDIFTDENLTIHQEKARCKFAYKTNSYIQVQVNSLTNKILGQDPKIKSENEVIERFGQKWQHFSNFKGANKEAIREALTTGDGFIKKMKGSKGSFQYQNIENSEDIYIDWDFKNNRPKRYIQRVYRTEASWKNTDIDTFTLKMPWGVETINGIEHDPSEIIHYKFMDSHYGIYGRSPIASVLNDIRLMDRMERSIAVISMYKAIPKKMLMPESNEQTNVLSQDEIDQVLKEIQDSSDSESPVIGKAMKTINLTDGGQAIDLNGYLDKFKRKISMVLTPQYMIHGDMQNRSTSEQQDKSHLLDLQGIRDEFLDEVNQAVQEGMTRALQVLADQGTQIPAGTFYYVFGEYEVESRFEKQQRILQEWDSGTITLNEYRLQNGYERDEQLGDFYKHELSGTQQEQALQSLKQMLGEK